jgi:hypothetical protein
MIRFLLGVLSGALIILFFLWETSNNIDFPLWIVNFTFIVGFVAFQADKKQWW